MNVLLLTPRPESLIIPLQMAGDSFDISMAEPSAWPGDIDFIVSSGYRHIIKEPYLSQYKNRMINLHISILPWNRGADPNFWSWFDDTPKGVSAHIITGDLDQGPVIGQMNVNKWRPGVTLRSSHDFLQECIATLFYMEWPRWRRFNWFYLDIEGDGTVHKMTEREPWFRKLPKGWDTPCSEVTALGKKARAQ